MKIHLNNQTAELKKQVDDSCVECPFNASKYSRCPYCSDTILDCYNKDWVIIRPANIFFIMKVALNDKDIKEVETESMCMECILYSYDFCPCHFDKSSIMMEDSFLSEIFEL